jgi:glucose dehydrogenase
MRRDKMAGADHIGELQAWNVDSGKRVWTTNMPAMSQNWGPVLATGGGLLFAGGTNDRLFRAFDAKSGQILWEVPMSLGVTGVPVSYEVEGRQFIAVQSGWGRGTRAPDRRSVNRGYCDIIGVLRRQRRPNCRLGVGPIVR